MVAIGGTWSMVSGCFVAETILVSNADAYRSNIAVETASLCSSFKVRIGYAVVSGILHVVLSWQFNFVWCNSPSNAIDGGPLGVLTWAIPAIVGTLACHLVAAQTLRTPWMKLIVTSVALMVAGWGLSCGTRFYDVPPSRVDELKEQRLAENPVAPIGEQLQFRGFAEAPFVQPPPMSERK